ncbi:hypothetical protein [Nannocystis bainbridge]|uniref:hypothetical protein n=1 Tax=Nannocystis bainbridge TaxID=2995303 RepID=UPI0023EEE610|nr:hypothetical protein [Nannocystis bainbridge]
MLARPVTPLTLVTAVRSALRDRRRQYVVRDLVVRERAAREAAETVTRLKDEFLATVSHELRPALADPERMQQVLWNPAQQRHQVHARGRHRHPVAEARG